MSMNNSISNGSHIRHGLRWAGAVSSAIGLLVNTITLAVTWDSFNTNSPTILAGWAYLPVSRIHRCRSLSKWLTVGALFCLELCRPRT